MTNSSTTTDHLAPRPDKPPIVVGAALPRARASDAARTILGDGGIAALSTLMADGSGIPFGSVIAFATGARGDPTFCISELAEHTRNLHADPRASLLVTETLPEGADPLALGRVTLIGQAGPVPDAEQGAATEPVVA
ncbi:MAG: pyridoxamine 5'-phosphate oxidase family protein, partial [Acidimicrobiales bacterium]